MATDYKELIERYQDAIYEEPENYLDELHGALQNLMSERDRLREALKACRAYAAPPVSRDDGYVIFNVATNALQEAGDEE